MPGARTPGKWPYRAEKPGRSRRVIKTRDGAPRGVHRKTAPPPRFRITRLQARVAFAAAVLVMLASAGWWAYHAPWVTVRQVSISGTSQVSPEQVRAAAGLDGSSVFRLDLESAQARVARANGRKIISISSEYLFQGSNIHDFGRYADVDLAIAADAEATLPSLIEEVRRLITPEKKAAFQVSLPRWKYFGSPAPVAESRGKPASAQSLKPVRIIGALTRRSP